MTEASNILWQPSAKQIAKTEVTAFMQALAKQGVSVNNFSELYDWSIADSQSFWSHYWDFAGVIGDKGEIILENGDDIEKAVWFSDAKLNYAENLLHHFLQSTQVDATAIYFKAEDKKSYRLSHQDLIHQVTVLHKPMGWRLTTGRSGTVLSTRDRLEQTHPESSPSC